MLTMPWAADSGRGESHTPVLYEEALAALDVRAGGRYIDATAGRGGHTSGILDRSAPDGQVLAIDTDADAVAAVRARLAPFGDRARVMHGNFRSLGLLAQKHGWSSVDGILLDLGVSSPQLEAPERGFSFLADGPLDMRLDPAVGQPAAALVNTLGEQALADLFYTYGEERGARRLARAIVAERHDAPLRTTAQLARLAERVLGRRGRIHPATRAFQALRIAVNGELDALEAALPQAVALLRPGGRLAVIAFHSLEDRIAKTYMQQEMMTCICPPASPVCHCLHRPTLRGAPRGAIKAGPGEVQRNTRARSARLRVAERV